MAFGLGICFEERGVETGGVLESFYVAEDGFLSPPL
jgi:hypothetical protein